MFKVSRPIVHHLMHCLATERFVSCFRRSTLIAPDFRCGSLALCFAVMRSPPPASPSLGCSFDPRWPPVGDAHAYSKFNVSSAILWLFLALQSHMIHGAYSVLPSRVCVCACVRACERLVIRLVYAVGVWLARPVDERDQPSSMCDGQDVDRAADDDAALHCDRCSRCSGSVAARRRKMDLSRRADNELLMRRRRVPECPDDAALQDVSASPRTTRARGGASSLSICACVRVCVIGVRGGTS
jgi:hypothetical protein